MTAGRVSVYFCWVNQCPVVALYYTCHSGTGISGLREAVFAFRVLSCAIIFTLVVWITHTRKHS